MKKLSFILITGCLLCLNIACFGQRDEKNGCYCKKEPAFLRSGQAFVQFGIGASPMILKDKGRTIVPPVDASLDYLLREKFSLGLMVGHSVAAIRPKKNLGNLSAYRWENDTYYAGLRASVHGNPSEHWNIYGGFMLGYFLHCITPNVDDPYSRQIEGLNGMKRKRGQLSYTGFVGLRYLTRSRFTFFGELGYGVSLVRVGAGYRVLSQ